VRLARFELTTFAFGGQRSIQLSYRRLLFHFLYQTKKDFKQFFISLRSIFNDRFGKPEERDFFPNAFFSRFRNRLAKRFGHLKWTGRL
jgi:hypothetical protein